MAVLDQPAMEQRDLLRPSGRGIDDPIDHRHFALRVRLREVRHGQSDGEDDEGDDE